MAEKIYCGNGKVIETKYGQMMKLSFTRDDLKKMLNNLDANDWVNANVVERRTPSKGGMTHYLVIDLWKPEDKVTPDSDSNVIEESNLIDSLDSDDLPF